ncbi:MAG: porin family protein [Gammaproteobacteria bacterium]|nr:porin family protein [Gammaproteobacteria bacterium]
MNHTMKSFLLGGLLTTFAFSSVQAVELTEKGVKLGVNMASFSGTDAQPDGVTNSSHAGVSVGGFGVWGINDKLSLQSEVLFSQKGVTMDVAGTKTPINLSYLEVPVTVEFALPVAGHKVNLFGGPYMGILLAADSDGTDIKDNTKTIDYGLQLGAGTIFQKKYLIDARYSMGLSSIDGTDNKADTKNSGFVISGGYLF